jgi:hypothetical protein
MIEMRYFYLNYFTDRLFDRIPALPIDIFIVAHQTCNPSPLPKLEQDPSQRLRFVILAVSCPQHCLTRVAQKDVPKAQRTDD